MLLYKLQNSLGYPIAQIVCWGMIANSLISVGEVFFMVEGVKILLVGKMSVDTQD